MRSRKEIENSPKTIEQLTLEVLLDIRDFFMPEPVQEPPKEEPIKKVQEDKPVIPERAKLKRK